MFQASNHLPLINQSPVTCTTAGKLFTYLNVCQKHLPSEVDLIYEVIGTSTCVLFVHLFHANADYGRQLSADVFWLGRRWCI